MTLLQVCSIATVEAMLTLLMFRDRALFDHSHRVARLAVRLGRTLHMTDDQIADLKQAAFFHDVGKLAVPEAVLDKLGPLDDHERALLRRHPEFGYEVMKAVPLLVAAAAELVLASHEAYDGSGYPLGLRREQIPLEKPHPGGCGFLRCPHARAQLQGARADGAGAV